MIALLSAVVLGQGTLLQQVVPMPTGRNGYEEYLRAADVLREGDAHLYVQWKEGDLQRLEREAASDQPTSGEAARLLPLARRLAAMGTLERRRETLLKFAVALDWVKQGNAKPVRDPWVGAVQRQKFPEMRHIRDLAQLAAVAAYVRDAEGRTGPATDALLQVIEMGDRIGEFMPVSLVNGIVMQSTAIGAMGERLDRMSRADAIATVGAVQKVLQRPPPVGSALEAGVRENARIWRDMLSRPVPWPPDVASGEPAMDRLQEALARLMATDRSKLAAFLDAYTGTQIGLLKERFSGPESAWLAPDPDRPAPTDLRTVEGIGERLVALTTSGPRTFGISAARVRTQVRLLRLAARVVVFKWDHERLPARLEDVAPPGDLKDPLSGEVFQYQPLSDRFRVWSKGAPITGEIDLRYEYPTSQPPPLWECADSSALWSLQAAYRPSRNTG